MPNKASTKQKFILVAIALTFTISCLIAGRFFLADVYFYQGKRFINKAEARKKPAQQLEQLAIATSYLNKAIALNSHTDYLSLKASTLLWQSGLNPNTAKANLSNAQKLYQQALQQRPSAPHLWLGLAESLALQKQLNKEFSLAIAKASQLGFYEAMVQQRLLAITLPIYPHLKPEDKALVKNVYQTAIKVPKNSQELIELGKSSGLFALFCAQHPQLADYPRNVKRSCDKLFGR